MPINARNQLADHYVKELLPETRMARMLNAAAPVKKSTAHGRALMTLIYQPMESSPIQPRKYKTITGTPMPSGGNSQMDSNFGEVLEALKAKAKELAKEGGLNHSYTFTSDRRHQFAFWKK